MKQSTLFYDLNRYYERHNDVPSHFEIKAKTLNDPVQLKFLKEQSPSAMRFKNTSVASAEVFRMNTVNSIVEDYDHIKETAIKNLIVYVNHAKKQQMKNVHSHVTCVIVAPIDTKDINNVKLGETFDITITVHCHSKISSGGPLTVFNTPLNLLIPIADIIDEIEIHSSQNKLDRVVAKIKNICREDFHYVFENPTYYVHEETKKQWLNQFKKVYRLISNSHGEVLSLLCHDGLLGPISPLQTRAEHQYFEGFEPGGKVTSVYYWNDVEEGAK